ncbi:hypothetical protein JB92DRAFT_732753 [Gautieria morchelliformis]|nr:hypothetical protein JB92DRAFT_732753 [Gautieria morchelliformis]
MLLSLSSLSTFSRLRGGTTTFPQLPRNVSTANSIGVTSTVPTTTSTTHRTTSSGFLSEARTSVTSFFGPGSTIQKTILAAEFRVVRVNMRRMLSRIKRTIRRQPFIFLGPQGIKAIQEVDYIYNRLQDLSRFPSDLPNIQRKVERLVLEISVLILGPSEIITLKETSRNRTGLSRMWIELVSQAYIHPLLCVRPLPSAVNGSEAPRPPASSPDGPSGW